MTSNARETNEIRTPTLRGRLLLGAIMVLAILSFLTITTHAPKAVGGGIYELEVSNLADANLLAGQPATTGAHLKKFPSRSRHARNLTP